MEAPSYELAEPFVVRVPRLLTKRLLLREFRPTDFEEYAGFFTDPVATAFLSGVVDRRQASRTFGSSGGAWTIHGRGWWTLETRDGGEVAGTVGAFVRDGYPDLELGWTVYSRFWRRGFAAEAARAVKDYAIAEWGATRLIAHISNGNTASVGVAEKIGLVYEGQHGFYGEPLGRWGMQI